GPRRSGQHEPPELLAARLEVAKLIEARGSRAEQHDLAVDGRAARRRKRPLERAAALDGDPGVRRPALERGGDLRAGLADQIDGAGARGDVLAERPEVLSLAAPAEDQVHAAGSERPQ